MSILLWGSGSSSLHSIVYDNYPDFDNQEPHITLYGSWKEIDHQYQLVAYPKEEYGVGGPVGTPHPWRVAISKVTGADVMEVGNAIPGNPVKELNEKGNRFSFSVPIGDPAINSIYPMYSEVKFFWGNKILWEGVVTAKKANNNNGMVEYSCKGLWFYLSKRTASRTPKKEFIENNSFQDGMTGWGVRGVETPNGPALTPSRSIVTEPRMSSNPNDKMALKLEGRGQQHDGFVYQHFGWTVPTNRSEGDEFVLTAWVYIPSDTYYGPAYGARGLFMEIWSRTKPHQNPGLAAQGYKQVLASANTPIDDSTPKDKWIRMQTTITAPVEYSRIGFSGWTPNPSPVTVSFRLYPPYGVAIWDEITLTYNERLVYKSVDQSTIVRELVELAQDEDYGKSDLRITPFFYRTGIKRTHTYLFSDRTPIDEILEDYTNYERGIDVEILSSGGSRYLIGHYPHRGQYKAKYALETGRNVADFDFVSDGEDIGNQIVVRSDFDDAGREEGVFSEVGGTSTYQGGLVLETIYDATPGSAITSLYDQAKRGHRRYSEPYDALRLRCYNHSTMELWFNLQEGDETWVHVSKGQFDASGRYRIIKKELDTDTSEVLFDVVPKEYAYDADVT